MDVKKTVLFESHKNLGARFINFAGWRMPFSYTNPGEEHLNVRRFGGLFDVSHMGEIRIHGKRALEVLKKLLPTDIQKLKEGEAQYSALLNYQGGIIDDIIVYCLSFCEDYFLCVNASSKEKVFSWICEVSKGFDVRVEDETDLWGLVAVQGPKSFSLCERIFKTSFLQLKKFQFQKKEGILFSRTGYTGEEGLEIYLPLDKTKVIWEILVEEGRKISIFPAGLGARDTLRLEMGYLLSGEDFDETRTLKMAGLNWLNRNPEGYIGKTSTLPDKGERLKGFIVEEPSGVPRKGCVVLSEEGISTGVVTSGAKSPTLEKMIGLAYIKGEGDQFFLEIHGQKVRACKVLGAFFKNKI